jgi:hypothetical protein
MPHYKIPLVFPLLQRGKWIPAFAGMTFILYPIYFSRRFIFPVAALLQGPVKLDSAFDITGLDTAAAVPAFFRVQDNWRFTLFRIRNIDIYRADIDTEVAAPALIGKDNRAAGRRHIRYSKYLFRHEILQITNDYSS